MKKKKESQKSRKIATKSESSFMLFSLLFVGLILLFHFLLLNAPQFQLFLQNSLTRVMAFLIGFTGIEVIRDGIFLSMGTHRWEFIPECTAVSAVIVFVSFVFACKSPLLLKGLGIVLGVPVLVAANILRLLAQAWVIRLVPQYGDAVHAYVWQILFLILVVFMCLVWTDKVKLNESKTAVSR